MRKCDARTLAIVECNRLRNEGYKIPRAIWHKIALYDTIKRPELRKIILKEAGYVEEA